MKYTHEIWEKRHRQRSDISTYISHLTRKTDKKEALEVLYEILKSQKLIGSSADRGFIIGDNPAVCFQDIPLYGVSQNIFHEQLNRKELGDKLRYNAVGLAFEKQYIFNNGGRPVFYEQKSIAKALLPKEEWWRIVSFDLKDSDNIIDWTHEREWRIKGDLEFELNDVVILLTKQKMYRRLIERYGTEVLKNVGGIVVMDAILS